MRYLLDIERPIFLHFLNREAAQAFGSNRGENTDLIALDVLTITHCSKLSVNISQMMEYTFEKPKLQEQIIRLINAGILITSSHDVDIGNFINSRQIMYQSVADRYPMYFMDEPSIENFSIKQTNSFSMTKLLRRDILDISEGDLALFARRARPEDIKDFQRNIGAFQDIAFRERDHAITRANFAIFAKSLTEK